MLAFVTPPEVRRSFIVESSTPQRFTRPNSYVAMSQQPSLLQEGLVRSAPGLIIEGERSFHAASIPVPWQASTARQPGDTSQLHGCHVLLPVDSPEASGCRLTTRKTDRQRTPQSQVMLRKGERSAGCIRHIQHNGSIQIDSFRTDIGREPHSASVAVPAEVSDKKTAAGHLESHARAYKQRVIPYPAYRRRIRQRYSGWYQTTRSNIERSCNSPRRIIPDDRIVSIRKLPERRGQQIARFGLGIAWRRWIPELARDNAIACDSYLICVDCHRGRLWSRI
jgi:hypothetical protein